MRAMFSHIVVFWTNPAYLGAVDELLAGADQLLKDIPGVEFELAGYKGDEAAQILKSWRDRITPASSVRVVEGLARGVGGGNGDDQALALALMAKLNIHRTVH